MTKPEFKEVVKVLVSFYPFFKLDSTQQLKMWFAALQDLPFEQVCAGIIAMVRAEDKTPTVAQIRRYAEVPDETYAEQWQKVLNAIGAYGTDNKPEFSQPTEMALMAIGGWRELCQTQNKNLGTLNAQFREAYKHARETIAKRDVFQQLGVVFQPKLNLPKPMSLAELLPANPNNPQ